MVQFEQLSKGIESMRNPIVNQLVESKRPYGSDIVEFISITIDTVHTPRLTHTR